VSVSDYEGIAALPRKMDVELKGGMYTFMSLKLYTSVVDLTELDVAELSLDTSVLLERIRSHKLVPIVASVVNKGGSLAGQISLRMAPRMR